MQAEEVLTVLAEISIALAGFTGIVVAFRQRGLGGFQPHELVRLRFMLGTACLLLFFALFPFLLHYMAFASDSTWALSSAALAVGLVGLALIGYFQTRDPVLSRSKWTYSYTVGSVVFAAIALANGLALWGSATPGLYLAALGWLLFFSVSLFVRLVQASAAVGFSRDRPVDTTIRQRPE